MSDDHAHILFPSDAPKSQQPPDWFVAQRSGAELRLAGVHGDRGAAAKAAEAGKAGSPASPAGPATRLFPNEAAKADDARNPAGSDAENAADKLFPEDAKKFDDAFAKDFFSGFSASAAADGDIERAQALNSAGEALIANARTAGMDAAELTSALDIVRERQGDTIAPLTSERMEAEFASGMAAIQTEYGDGYMNEVNAARSFIRDMEIIAPGTIASLERTGAGNDPRLIRTAIKEARRRGYK